MENRRKLNQRKKLMILVSQMNILILTFKMEKLILMILKVIYQFQALIKIFLNFKILKMKVYKMKKSKYNNIKYRKRKKTKIKQIKKKKKKKIKQTKRYCNYSKAFKIFRKKILMKNIII